MRYPVAKINIIVRTCTYVRTYVHSIGRFGATVKVKQIKAVEVTALCTVTVHTYVYIVFVIMSFVQHD